MTSNKQDRRVRKTKNALRNGLIKLMETKSIREITVKELSDLIDINRGTFYFHYKDIYDLLAKIEKEFLTKITGILDQYLDEEAEALEVITNLNYYIKENAEVFHSLFNHNTNREFSLELAEIVQRKYLTNWIKKNFKLRNEQDLLFYSDFLMMGYIGLISRWLKEEIPIPPEELSKKMVDLAIWGIPKTAKNSSL